MRPQYQVQARAARLRRRRQAGPQAGGSLVELLIVVAILLVVLAMALPRLMAARQSAQQASAVAFLRHLHAAQEQFRIANGNYAGTFAQLEVFLAANAGSVEGSRPLPPGLLTPPSQTTLAFLLLPAMSFPDEPVYTNASPHPPRGTSDQESGAGVPQGAPPSDRNPNPPGKNRGGSGPGAGEPGESREEDADSNSQGGSAPGLGAGASESGDWSQADRILYQGYEFHLLRLTAHTWRCIATPVRDGQNAHHYFADQTGMIRREFARPAGPHSPVL